MGNMNFAAATAVFTVTAAGAKFCFVPHIELTEAELVFPMRSSCLSMKILLMELDGDHVSRWDWGLGRVRGAAPRGARKFDFGIDQ